MNENTPDLQIESVFARYEPEVQACLRKLRAIIFDVAEEENAGPLEETLKWGQPSYLTNRSKAGTTVRIDADQSNGGRVALYVNCQTSLVGEWRERFDDFSFGGNRSVHLASLEDIDRTEVRMMIADALTYHRRKRRQ